jgi:hypothetical protein
MKNKALFPILLITGMIVSQAAFADTLIKIEGENAKRIYNRLTGPAVDEEGAAGHIFRTGKSIFCRYTNADVDDSQGNPMPRQDARRFQCLIKFNKNGYAAPGK